MKYIILLSLAFSLIAKDLPLETVDKVDLNRYLGTWYEIARFDQTFQKGCTAVSAIYSKRKDGDINVDNSCRIGSPQGKLKQSTGRAWVVDTKTNAKLKVQFFLKWFKLSWFSGDYWIIELDEDNYSYAVIGEPSRQYLWILSRTKTMEESLYNELVARIRDQGFETSKLLRTLH